MAAAFAKARVELRGFANDSRRLGGDIDGLNTRLTSMNRRVGNLTDKLKAWRSELRNFAGDGDDADNSLKNIDNALARVGGRFDGTSRSTRSFTNSIRSTGGTVRSTTRDVDRHGAAVRKTGDAYNYAGKGVGSFDNQLRGIALLAAIGFAQQLITVLVGLGGELVAVAASAAQAGVALGGILVAGIGQALPAIGLLIGAMTRVKATIDAVQQATKLQQAQSQARFQSARKEADGADAIANANDSLTSALQGVGDAHDRLTQAERQSQLAQEGITTARRDATRQLHDMIVAEQDAKRAADGAVLSQLDAQRALEQAVRSGDDLAVQHAQAALEEAKANVQRTRLEARRQTSDTGRAVSGGVEGMEGLQQAKRAADDAARAVEQANQGVQNSERAVTRATRGIETARRNAQEAVSGTQTAAANLNFLLSQLSPAERRLYEAIRRIQRTWKTAWTGPGGIMDPIIDSFTRSVDRVNRIMQMPSVLQTARRLATSMGQQFDRITDSFTSDKQVAQFSRLAELGRKNLQPLTTLLIRLGRAFTNIAEGASPAFSRFLGFVNQLALRFLRLTSNQGKVEEFFLTAERHLESWINLTIAVVNFFAAISGAGGAAEGKRSIDALTAALDGWTKRINRDGSGVRRFFKQVHEVTGQIVRVLVALGRELAKAFSPDKTEHFADFLVRVVIPALGMLIKVTGTFANLFAIAFGNPIISQITQVILTITALGFIIRRVEGAALLLRVGFGEIFKIGPSFVALGSRVAAYGRTLAFAGDAQVAYAGKTTLLTRAFTLIGPAIARAGVIIRAAAAFAFGPWGLAIGAVILAIILLDKKFHFLGATFKWLQGAVRDTLDWLKTHWPLVLTILTGPFGLAVTIIAKNWDKIKHGVRAAFDAIVDLFQGGGGRIGEAMRTIGRLILRYSPVGILARIGVNMAKALYGKFGDTIIGFFKDIGEWLFRHVIKPIYDFFEIKSPSGLFERIGKNLARGLINGFKQLPHLLSDLIHGMGDALESIGKRIGEALLRGIKKIGGIFKSIGSFLADPFTSGGGGDGSTSTSIRGALGGPVPGGFGGGDRIPALLEPGEHILTKSEVQAAGGHRAIFALRAILGGGGQSSGLGYAAGGAAQNNPQGTWVADQRQLNIEKALNRDMEKEDRRTEDVRVKQVSEMWEDIKRITRRGANYVEAQWRDMRVNTTATTKRMLSDAVEAWTKTWRQLDKLAYEGLFYIGHESNLALTAFGGKAIDFHLTAPTVQRRAEGGFMVPGSGSGDKIPALLEPGEFVFNKVATNKIGRSVLEFLNFQGIPRFAKGGFTGPGHSGEGFTPMWNFAKSKFGMSYFTGFDGHSKMTTSNNVSDHFFHRALDMGNGVLTAGEDALNAFIKTKIPQVIKQLIWRSIDQIGGFNIGDHEDHVHLAMPDQYAFDGSIMAKILSRASRGLSITDLLKAGTDDIGAPLIDHVDHVAVRGPRGPFRSMMQRMFNLVRRAGNKRLDSVAMAGADPGLEKALGIGASIQGKGIFSFFRSQGFSPAQAAAWVGNFTQESGLDPSRVQPGGPGRGLAQWGGGRFAALVDFAKGLGKPWQDAGAQLAFVMHELNGPERSAMMSIRSAHTIADAVAAIATQYERAGIIGDRLSPARAAYNAYAHFAQGGIVPGGDGTPVPIIAHASEWILNRLQQSKLARMLGVSVEGLKGALGFHGRPGNAQGGLDVPEPRVVHGGPIDVSAIKQFTEFVKQLATIKLPDLGQDTFRSVSNLFEDIGNVFDRVRRLSGLANKARKSAERDVALKAFFSALDKITGEGQLLDRLRTSIDRRVTQAARRLTLDRFRVGAGRVVTERLSGPQLAERQLQDVRGQRTDLLSERDEIAQELKRVQGTSRKGLSAKQKQRLQAQENDLKTRLDDAQGRVADNIQAIFDAQQALLEARIAEQQEAVDNITKSAERQSSFLDFSRRVATVFGNQGALAQINAAQRGILADEANQLEARIGAAAASGATDLADQLEVQVADLRTQIVESLAAELADAAQRIQAQGQRRSSRLDLFSRLLAATGTIGQTAAVSLGGESFSAAGLAAQQQANTANQISQTQELLNRVQREQPENVQLIEQLTDSLADLSVTIQEQARAAFIARVEDVNARADFTLGINDLNKQILDLQGQIAGQADQAGLLVLAQQRQGILTQKGNELQALYNEAIANRDQQAINDLQKAVLENKVALLQNTVTLNELAGVMKDPQTFSSSAWSIFREAIFSGMGQVLPQFSFPMADTGGIVSRTGLMQLHAGELIRSAGSWTDKMDGGDTFNIYEAGRPIDTTELTGVIAFARKTHQ